MGWGGVSVVVASLLLHSSSRTGEKNPAKDAPGRKELPSAWPAGRERACNTHPAPKSCPLARLIPSPASQEGFGSSTELGKALGATSARTALGTPPCPVADPGQNLSRGCFKFLCSIWWLQSF